MLSPELNYKKKIIIVGNAEPKKDYSSLIESHDTVIRFNHVPYLASNKVGERTDILVVQNMDTNYRSGAASCNDWHELYILAENPKNDLTQLIIGTNGWKNRAYSTIYTDYLDIKSKLQGTGGSSGFSIIEWFLTTPNNSLFQISIVCFSWEGWSGHAWSKEKEWCLRYQEEGKIDIVC